MHADTAKRMLATNSGAAASLLPSDKSRNVRPAGTEYSQPFVAAAAKRMGGTRGAVNSEDTLSRPVNMGSTGVTVAHRRQQALLKADVEERNSLALINSGRAPEIVAAAVLSGAAGVSKAVFLEQVAIRRNKGDSDLNALESALATQRRQRLEESAQVW